MAEILPRSLGMGQNTLQIPVAIFADNRSRLVKSLQENPTTNGGIVVLQGGNETPLYNTDVGYSSFRQEPFFQWAFGVRDAGCYGAIQISNGYSVLFVPKPGPNDAVWVGKLPTLNEFKEKYEVDRVEYTETIGDVLQQLNGPDPILFTLSGINSDSKLAMADVVFPDIERFAVNKEILWDIMTECRVRKSAMEVAAIKYTNAVSSAAHKMVMREMGPELLEYQCEALFLAYCYFVGGCRNVSYTCICGSGDNSAVLHYGHASAPNDKVIKDGDMCLFDMGCNYFGYASDITCSFPANGKFTDDQKLVYNAVLSARNRVIELAKPGVSWKKMHEESYRAMLQALKDGGLLQGDVEDMIAAGIGAVFQAHGLGHLLGLDVHDVGGYPPNGPPRPTEPGFSSLRTARVLEAGMVLTVEPGCYFVDALLDPALADPVQSQYLVPEVIQRFRGFGGVRIEDDVLITDTGVENLTVVPRTVEEIEDWMAKPESEETLKQGTKDAHSMFLAAIKAMKDAGENTCLC